MPPHLSAVFASGMVSNILYLTLGVFETGRRLQWTYNMAVDARRKSGDQRGPSTRSEADRQWHQVERGKWIWRLPLDNIPTCQVTGWYDRLVGTINNYSGMVQNGPYTLRDQHRIIIGPWGHDNSAFIRHQGPLDFGPDTNTTYEDQVL